MKTEQTYPRIERAGFDIEVPRVRNGRPGYKWLTGWIVRFSDYRVSTPMTKNDALHYLAELKGAA